MKSAIVALAFAAGLVLAQDPIGELPKCANGCVTDYTTGGKIAGCAPLEISCICKNKDFLSGIACCLEKACDTSGKDAAVKFAQQICGSAGVNVPDKVVCSTGAASTGTAASAAETATKTGGAAVGTPAGLLGAAAALLFAL